MRVCYVTEEAISFSEPLTRGGAIHVRNVVSALRERGHEVFLVDWNPDPEYPFQRSVAPRTRFVEGPLRTALGTGRVARREGVGVVVSKTRKTYLPGLVAARAAGVPHVAHVGSLPGAVGDGAVERLDAASLVARLRAPHDAYFVACDAIGDALVARGVDPDRIHDVGNAVDADRFHPDRAPERPPAVADALSDVGDDFLVGYVGGLHRYKGLFDLAAAVDRCDADVTLVLAGEGPAREALEGAFGDDARFLGVVPYESMPAVYHAVDALVLPSHTEGLPRVVLEAMATATPVVATRVGGVPDVVTDGETGLLCEPRDPACLAGAVDDLASDPGLRADLGTRGRAVVAEDWSWPALYDRYERFLRTVHGESGDG